MENLCAAIPTNIEHTFTEPITISNSSLLQKCMHMHIYKDGPRSIIYNNQTLEKIKTFTTECINKSLYIKEHWTSFTTYSKMDEILAIWINKASDKRVYMIPFTWNLQK